MKAKIKIQVLQKTTILLLLIKQKNQLIKKQEKIKINTVKEKEEILTKTGIKIKVNLVIHLKIKKHYRMMKMNGIKSKKNKENAIPKLKKMMIAKKINSSLMIIEVEEEEVSTEEDKEAEVTEWEEV